jgi:hypothetical protein
MTRCAAAASPRGGVVQRSTARLISLSILLFAVLAPDGIGRAAEGAGRHSAATGNGRLPVSVVRLPNGTLIPVGPGRTTGDRLALRDRRSQAACTKTFQRSGFPDNVRVNTDCGGAGQQEETGAIMGVHYS